MAYSNIYFDVFFCKFKSFLFWFFHVFEFFLANLSDALTPKNRSLEFNEPFVSSRAIFWSDGTPHSPRDVSFFFISRIRKIEKVYRLFLFSNFNFHLTRWLLFWFQFEMLRKFYWEWTDRVFILTIFRKSCNFRFFRFFSFFFSHFDSFFCLLFFRIRARFKHDDSFGKRYSSWRLLSVS